MWRLSTRDVQFLAPVYHSMRMTERVAGFGRLDKVMECRRAKDFFHRPQGSSSFDARGKAIPSAFAVRLLVLGCPLATDNVRYVDRIDRLDDIEHRKFLGTAPQVGCRL